MKQELKQIIKKYNPKYNILLKIIDEIDSELNLKCDEVKMPKVKMESSGLLEAFNKTVGEASGIIVKPLQNNNQPTVSDITRQNWLQNKKRK